MKGRKREGRGADKTVEYGFQIDSWREKAREGG